MRRWGDAAAVPGVAGFGIILLFASLDQAAGEPVDQVGLLGGVTAVVGQRDEIVDREDGISMSRRRRAAVGAVGHGDQVVELRLGPQEDGALLGEVLLAERAPPAAAGGQVAATYFLTAR